MYIGEPNCQIPEHHYEIFIESLISDWQAEDRETRQLDWQAECKAMHSLMKRIYHLGVDSIISAVRYGIIHNLYFMSKVSAWMA